ncbi:ankyrin repeat-containing domain protein, partial [Trichophaea hybrida]
LTLAASLGHSEVVELLLSKGADINGQNGAAFKGAVKQGRQDMIALLLTRGANVEPQYIESVEVTAKAGRKDLVEVLLRCGVNINAEDVTPHGSALCAAVLGRNLEVIKMLIAAGANVNYPSPLGCPLQLAMVA